MPDDPARNATISEFTILKPIERGTWARSYLARGPGGARCILHIFSPLLDEESLPLEFLEGEMKRLASGAAEGLPQVVRWNMRRPPYWYAEVFVDARSIAEIIERLESRKRTYPFPQLVHTARNTVSILETLHGRGAFAGADLCMHVASSRTRIILRNYPSTLIEKCLEEEADVDELVSRMQNLDLKNLGRLLLCLGLTRHPPPEPEKLTPGKLHSLLREARGDFPLRLSNQIAILAGTLECPDLKNLESVRKCLDNPSRYSPVAHPPPHPARKRSPGAEDGAPDTPSHTSGGEPPTARIHSPGKDDSGAHGILMRLNPFILLPGAVAAALLILLWPMSVCISVEFDEPPHVPVRPPRMTRGPRVELQGGQVTVEAETNRLCRLGLLDGTDRLVASESFPRRRHVLHIRRSLLETAHPRMVLLYKGRVFRSDRTLENPRDDGRREK